jgi:WD40 repeat protein/DNA-binding SARP family transcriptional activator
VDNALRIYTLGGLSIECNEQPVNGFISRKVEALLVYLACTGRSQAREVLAELLWPERSQSQSLRSLRVGLSNLRQILPENVNITRRTVSLAADPATWIDVAEVEQLLASAGIRERREGILSDGEAKALVSALDFYRGDFLQGFYVADSRAFEEWAEMERDRLRRIVIEALHHLVLYDLQHGVYADGIAQATRLLSLDPLHEEINRHLILLLAQAGQRTQALAQYEAYCRLLDEELGVKPSSDLVALYRQIQSGAASRPAAPQIQPRVAVLANPYKGLHPFQEKDAPDFFGREASVQRLLSRLKEDGPYTRFLAVVGPSGSGKSSLVRAGLIPALRKGAIPGADGWKIVTILPGSHPLEELITALQRLAAPVDAALWHDREGDARGLLRIIKHTLPEDEHIEMLLLIDQFEEVFSLVTDENIRRHFLDNLLTALTEPHSRLRVVITLRADCYDRPLLYAELGELVRERTEVVLPLSPEELQRAIGGPAERLGVQVEPAVVAKIINDVNEQPGALPLLQYALTELFDRREDSRLTLAAYQAGGGVRGTLASRAESLYAGLDEQAQPVARQVFLRLVQVGENTEDTRRRVPWSEMVSLAGSDTSAHALIDHYAEHRLLTLDHNPTTNSATVELAHEALIREWRRFHTWIDESRGDLRQQRVLAAAAEEWRAAGQDRSYLLTGSRLAQVDGWAEQSGVTLTPDERTYLDSSRAEHERQRGRRRRARNVTLAAAVAVALVMTVLAGFAFDRERQAQAARTRTAREAAVNHSLVLAADAKAEYASGNIDLALLLALQATGIDDPPAESVRALNTVGLGAGTRAIFQTHTNIVKAVAFSPDSRRALSGSCQQIGANDTCAQGDLILWDVESQTLLRRLEGHTGWINGVAFSPDGQTALSASGDGTLILWDVNTGAIMRRFEGHSGGVNGVAFSPDGQTALSASDDATLILWDVSTGDIIRPFEGHTGAVTCVAFSPDGQTAVSGSADWTLILWDVQTGDIIHRFEGHSNTISAVAFVPGAAGDNQTILSASLDYHMKAWDVQTGAFIRDAPAFEDQVKSLAVTPDGRRALVGFATSMALFDLERWQMVTFYTISQIAIWSESISQDGRLALLGAGDGSLHLWNMGEQVELYRWTPPTASYSRMIRLLDEGRQLGSLYFTVDDSDPAKLAMALGAWNVDDSSPGFRQSIRRVVLTKPFEEISGNWGDYSPDGQYALINFGDYWGNSGQNAIVLYDVETGQTIRRFEGQAYLGRSVAFSPDGRTALTGSMAWTDYWLQDAWGQGELLLWDVASGALLRRFDTTDDVTSISFSRDGRRALTSSVVHPYIHLWDVETGKSLRECRFPSENGGYVVRFGPDEKTALAGSSFGALIQWNLDTCAIIHRFIGHTTNIPALDISPDGRYVLSGDESGNIILWNLETGEELRGWVGHSSAVWEIMFSPDGLTAYSASFDGSIRQWQIADWPLNELLAWVHANRYIRDFTCEERVLYRIEPFCR